MARGKAIMLAHGADGEASDEATAVVDRGEDRREDNREDGHKLHQDIKRRT